jgi:hypothetical protein
VWAALVAVAALGFGACGSDGEGGAGGGEEIDAALTTVSVWFLDSERYHTGEEPYLAAVPRRVPVTSSMDAAVDALFAGPTRAEARRGLTAETSGATGASAVGIERSTALVQLLGGCDSGGHVVTVASLLVPTLRSFDGVRWVKIYGPDGTTQSPDTPGDSVPECLEP